MPSTKRSNSPGSVLGTRCLITVIVPLWVLVSVHVHWSPATTGTVMISKPPGPVIGLAALTWPSALFSTQVTEVT